MTKATHCPWFLNCGKLRQPPFLHSSFEAGALQSTNSDCVNVPPDQTTVASKVPGSCVPMVSGPKLPLASVVS